MPGTESTQAIVTNRLFTNALQLPSDLPTAFPDVESPCFLLGDRLRWISNKETTDWGIAIGRFYSFAPHCEQWQWCYLIWLDPDSPSSAWVRADIAWEEDLEAYDEASINISSGSETIWHHKI